MKKRASLTMAVHTTYVGAHFLWGMYVCMYFANQEPGCNLRFHFCEMDQSLRYGKQTDYVSIQIFVIEFSHMQAHS